ncbi:MAG TPA: IS110 family transposase [Anaerolineae bacterium]|nr:IS110 family transposase [Anaerolineae bacterium]
MLPIIFKRIAGLDVHKKTVVATRMRVVTQEEVERETKTFGTTTPELLELHDWLYEWNLSHVAMESTGDYWKPVYNVLEDTFETWVVNARQVKNVPGRKTDVIDSKWVAQLMMHGLLRASFIPPKPQRALRELTRYRTKLVQERARLVNRLQKLLEGANIKLSSVVTDVMGVSARAMLAQIVAGQTDAELMADLARGPMRSKIPHLEMALTGIVQPHHRFVLTQQLDHIDFLDDKVETISLEIERQLESMSWPEEPAMPDAGEAIEEGTPVADQSELPLTWNTAVALLDTIPGVNRRVAEVMLAEMGLDMSQFPTANHLASWAGLAPGNHQSGGKRYSGRTTKGNKSLATIMVLGAWSAVRTKDTFLKSRYHRLAARRGKKRAIVAVAHSMLVSAWHMLTYQQPYQELGGDYFDERKKEAKVSYLVRRLERLTGGSVSLELHPAAA